MPARRQGVSLQRGGVGSPPKGRCLLAKRRGGVPAKRQVSPCKEAEWGPRQKAGVSFQRGGVGSPPKGRCLLAKRRRGGSPPDLLIVRLIGSAFLDIKSPEGQGRGNTLDSTFNYHVLVVGF